MLMRLLAPRAAPDLDLTSCGHEGGSGKLSLGQRTASILAMRGCGTLFLEAEA